MSTPFIPTSRDGTPAAPTPRSTGDDDTAHRDEQQDARPDRVIVETRPHTLRSTRRSFMNQSPAPTAGLCTPTPTYISPREEPEPVAPDQAAVVARQKERLGGVKIGSAWPATRVSARP